MLQINRDAARQSRKEVDSALLAGRIFFGRLIPHVEYADELVRRKLLPVHSSLRMAEFYIVTSDKILVKVCAFNPKLIGKPRSDVYFLKVSTVTVLYILLHLSLD